MAQPAGGVESVLEFQVSEPATVVVQMALPGRPDGERLSVTGAGGLPLSEPPVELPPAGRLDGGRQHLLRLPAGPVTVRYTAPVPAPPATGRRAEPGTADQSQEPLTSGQPPEPATCGQQPEPLTELDRVLALRPSRYCPSDRLAGFALGTFGHLTGDAERVRAITDHVWRHLAYEAGVSGPSTDAADTLLAGRGVCRDFAHLTTALCRAVDVPARVAAVYAPGLSPMDFHLVTEAAVDGAWYVWDSTRLAPRQSLLRIATGRDAADVAFSTVLAGRLELTGMQVTAVAPGDLPTDDHTAPVALA
ncbi:transglutaminase family protein [Solwaraspora sp. WMMD1047]|uniref:transglutaminase-like domain-containing protein n=1 Tax=Solwaraspora sp. WMMD1047 TaxID=3016102 RepID=UPI002416536B|nr:transglutaminase family protein [Solwaraspora sp. WMMD1047]MDG4830185.1 transglutaminase family protein [Solwaraspora sp. WMMD1047]